MGKITLQMDSSPFDGKRMEMSICLPDIYVAEKMDELLNYTKGIKMYPTRSAFRLPKVRYCTCIACSGGQCSCDGSGLSNTGTHVAADSQGFPPCPVCTKKEQKDG